ncbi:hypothetical protein Calag_1551 [Caldisphaera lagunensis DSM 15908]|uniref:6-pyruvoyl-tetrahydropterin synthase n=1 Tax=Caldisphaera lagunensis (strain DSM 15908 / JCM 11604 / ANMR 0165 / IC-154) TaxID=1056495 RepID=L0ACU4_CALLD|nr:hypothetical protein [Caldisphaera lagunensis]AFZ71249.1 hypothetical protein Calag_1551 [Caldisphaera lagunensis DSM 15908]
MNWKLCVSDNISVAMKIKSMGYDIHGHDIKITLCICEKAIDNKPVIDMETLQEKLSTFLKSINRKPLWEVTGNEGTFEDLLFYIKDNINIKNICQISAQIPNKEIYLEI